MTASATTPTSAAQYDGQRVREAIRDNVWLHFTQMAQFQDPNHRPLVLVRGDGSTVWDDQGNAYLDCLAGIYSVNAGYGQRRIIEAMMAQLEQLVFVNPFGYTSVPAAVLADRLGDLAPLGGNARVFFTSGGSESVETALKLAKQYHLLRGYPNRWKTISRRGAYHGTTMGALSVNGLSGARAPFGPLVPGARHAPMSHRYRCPYCKDAAGCTLACYEEIERVVEFEGPEQVAAIITEPVQNAGGCIPPGSMDYFKRIRALCDQTGILMIMDEVICGFGRLGELFGSTYFGSSRTSSRPRRALPPPTRRSAPCSSASPSPTSSTMDRGSCTGSPSAGIRSRAGRRWPTSTSSWQRICPARRRRRAPTCGVSWKLRSRPIPMSATSAAPGSSLGSSWWPTVRPKKVRAIATSSSG